MLKFSGRHIRLLILSHLVSIFSFFSLCVAFVHSPHDAINVLEVSPSYDQKGTRKAIPDKKTGEVLKPQIILSDY